jgi:predicted SAM-dependent methyltransferase
MTNLLVNEKYKDLADLYAQYGGDGFRLDLGCGFVKPAGFIGLDNLCDAQSQIRNDDNAPDILLDLATSPLPFPDNSCHEVRSSHFLEHSNLYHILTESYRVLKPGGIFLFAVPYANSAEGMYPGHVQFLTEKWFHKNLVFQEKFTILNEEYFPSEDWLAQPWFVRKLVPFKFARTFLFNACWQMMFHCTPKK